MYCPEPLLTDSAIKELENKTLSMPF